MKRLLILTAAAIVSAPYASAFADLVATFDEAGQTQLLQCSIEDIRGEALTIRRSATGTIQVLRLSNVQNLQFSRGPNWDQALQHLEVANHQRAIEYFDKALRKENRRWARNELLASISRTCISIGRYDDAIDRIERIVEDDPRTRHVSLLPLVWDSTLPEQQRATFIENDLSATSEIRRLIACSAGLGRLENPSGIESSLNALRRRSKHPRLAELAEAQLWRMYIVDAKRDIPNLQHRREMIQQMPVEARAGPLYVLGQLQERKHEYDEAAISFLWGPLVKSADRALAEASMRHAAACLDQSSRIVEAATVRSELSRRFPDADKQDR